MIQRPASAIALERILPNSMESEMAVLGSMLLDPQTAASEVCSRVEEKHFYYAAHQVLYREFSEMQDENQPVDMMTVTQRLADKGKLEEIGGPGYLADLISKVPTTANVGHYIDVVLRESCRREVIEAAHKASTQAFDNPDIAEWLSDVQQQFFDIGAASSSTGAKPIQELIKGTMDRIAVWQESPGVVVGIATGLRDIDRMLGGMRPGQMIVIAGRPGHGKSSLAMNIVENVAIKGTGVGVFSLEMSADELSDRMVTSSAHLSLRAIQAGKADASAFPKLELAASELLKTNIHIDDTAALTIAQIRSRARRMKRRFNIGLLVIDYLQLARGTGRFQKREEEVAEVSRGTKAMAKELGIPVLALCQLNRQADASDNVPLLSWLRESGSLEQDADAVGFLQRPILYAKEEDREALRGKAVLCIAKQRNGPTGDIKLTFLEQFTRFEDMARVEESDYPQN